MSKGNNKSDRRRGAPQKWMFTYQGRTTIINERTTSNMMLVANKNKELSASEESEGSALVGWLVLHCCWKACEVKMIQMIFFSLTGQTKTGAKLNT